MKSLAVALLIGFAGMAVFGFFAMLHDGHAGGECFASIMADALCPSGVVESAAHHLTAYKAVTGATAAAWSALLTLLFLVPLAAAARVAFPEPRRAPAYAVFLGTGRKELLLRWLSLHENSPSSA